MGPDGAFSQSIPGYTPRLQQIEMMQVIQDTLQQQGILVAEAGTGTGKTYAYLVPALLSGAKVIISTGTKNLQDQLFHRDLPIVRKVLGASGRVALLKGRGNYLCTHRLELADEQRRANAREFSRELATVRRWSGNTRSGDISELTEIAEDARIWPLVTSTGENCLGQECPRLSECHVMRARRQAQESDIVVINHHLFFADMALKGEGVADLLPSANAVIFDEAHQLPEVASNFFGTTLSTGQLAELVSDTLAEQAKEAPENSGLIDIAESVLQAARVLRPLFGEAAQRFAWSSLSCRTDVMEGMTRVGRCLEILQGALEHLAARGKGLDNCFRRAGALLERWRQLTGATPDNSIHWLEAHRHNFALHLTPMDIAPLFRRHIEGKKCAWVFTSATLAVGGQFDHFLNGLGLEQAHTRAWDSPFDYAHQALLYVPSGLPEPNDINYTSAVVDAAIPVLQASQGRAFLLVTSHRALQEAARLLQGRLSYPLLVQGDMPRSQLLAKFRQLGNAILIGTSSFWEGVDVRGDALSCVIIDKLPFASPGDPVMQARLDALRERGANPFRDYQLPQAVITLKQGVGRLIRDCSDRGVLMLCDPRLLGRSYGKIFLASIPSMARTRKLVDVEQFFS